MADTKISALTDGVTAVATDRLPVARDPFGAGDNAYLTPAYVKDYILGLANTWTATQTITPAANTNALAVTGYSLTGSNAQSLVDLAGTWNTSGTPTAIKLNITNTASGTLSYLIDLQTGGTSRFSVGKLGDVFVPSTASYGVGLVYLTQNGLLTFSTTATVALNNDTILARDAANTLAQRNGTNAQTFRIYKTYTDASNYERLSSFVSANVFYIQSEAAGTGTPRNLRISAGASEAGNGGYISIAPDGAIEFARSGTATWAGFSSTGVFTFTPASLTGSKATSALDIAQTWNTSGTPTAIKLNITNTASNAASRLFDVQVGGTSRFYISAAGTPYFRNPTGGSNQLVLGTLANDTGGVAFLVNGAQLEIYRADQGAYANFVAGNLTATGGSFNLSSGNDLFLARDAANTLAQRNGTNAQTFRVYNTYTDASNYERLNISWDTNVCYLRAIAAGTGSARSVSIMAGENVRIGGGDTDGSLTVFSSSSITSFIPHAFVQYQEILEMTAPSAAPANRVRVYAEDNGAGKTRLMAIFATGAAQQIAIEP